MKPPLIDDSTRATVSAGFSALEELFLLTNHPADSPPGASFNALYQFAHDPSRNLDPHMVAALAEFPQLRESLDLLLERTATRHFSRAAAASSGELNHRESDGCRIVIKSSKADANQVYVLIHLPVTSAAPNFMVVKSTATGYHKEVLPPPTSNGVIQLVAEVDSKLVSGLRDVQSEIYLR